MRKDVDLVFDVLTEVVTALRGNATLLAVLGGDTKRVRQVQSHQEEVVPSVAVEADDSEPEETNVRCVLRFHWFGTTLQEARTLRKLTLETVHSDYTMALGDMRYFTQPFGVETNPEPREGVAYLSEDVEFNPYRFYTDE